MHRRSLAALLLLSILLGCVSHGLQETVLDRGHRIELGTRQIGMGHLILSGQYETSQQIHADASVSSLAYRHGVI